MTKIKKLDQSKLIFQASRIYRWIWWSPILTVPTAIFLLFFFYYFGYGFVILVSAFWHGLFLRKAFIGKHDPFVKWHARQALLLAGIRTIIAYAVVEISIIWLFVLVAVWFFGNILAGRQVKRGDCWLWRKWNGKEFQEFQRSIGRQIPAELPIEKPESTKIVAPNSKNLDPRPNTQVEYGRQKTVQTLLAALQGGTEVQQKKALAQLEALGEVEVF